MDMVVIAYSLGGKTERIAQEIAGALSADFCRIECPKYADVEIDRAGAGLLLNVVPMAFSSLFGGRPEIDLECDLRGYDCIVLGFPIWANNPATPINTLLQETDFKEKSAPFLPLLRVAAPPATHSTPSGKRLLHAGVKLSTWSLLK